MSPLAWAVLGCEFLLETSGAILSYRKRLKILFALLAWRAAVDIITLGVHFLGSEFSTRSVTWGARAVQYAILYALGAQIASKMVAEYKPLTQYVYMLLAVVGSAAAYVFAMTDVWASKFAGADAVTSLMLLAVVLLGWIGKKQRLEGAWTCVTLGIVISAMGNAMCAVFAAKWKSAWSLYPVPAIAALMIWNWAAWKAQIEPKSFSLRLNLGPRIEPEKIESLRFGPRSVGFVEAQRKWVN